MRKNNKHILLVKRANGQDLNEPKPMKMPVADADRLVSAKRAHFVSRAIYRWASGDITYEQAMAEQAKYKTTA